MTEQKLATLIATLEGKKSQSRIGNIREIIKLIQNLILNEVKSFEETKEMPIAAVLFKKADKYNTKKLKKGI